MLLKKQLEELISELVREKRGKISRELERDYIEKEFDLQVADFMSHAKINCLQHLQSEKKEYNKIQSCCKENHLKAFTK